MQAYFFFWIFLLVSSCGVKPPVIEWNYTKDGVLLTYKADKILNAYDNKPHTVIMAVFQLTSLDAYQALSKNQDGLKKLLRADRFDPSVANAVKFIVQPGDSNKVLFDRFENSKWIAVVAGYFELKSGSVNQVYEIPVRIEQKGFFRRKKVAHIDQAQLTVLLGPDSLHMIETN